ncbi:hypothetical protein PIB30_075260 [Stylosanthes scabra]|uniref:Uncharacterized protein n=1 Tax=Stylosanthes scabra TaxID=79078 RepID=A0ABU6ZNN2_9FABA|nr:hypothetical protein [Stylosanthes scabra]
MHRNGGYSPDDFVHKSLTMETVMATYNYVVHPVPREEYWNPIGCGGIFPPPIVCPAGRPRSRRIKDHVDMIIGKKESPNCDQGSNSGTSQPPMDPIEKARKSKKKKPRITPPSDIGRADEVDYSQCNQRLKSMLHLLQH